MLTMVLLLLFIYCYLYTDAVETIHKVLSLSSDIQEDTLKAAKKYRQRNNRYVISKLWIAANMKAN